MEKNLEDAFNCFSNYIDLSVASFSARDLAQGK